MEIGGRSSTDEKSEQVSIDIDKLAKSVKADPEISYAFSKACCIYRVPDRLRELNGKAYTPRVVSIGPIHHVKEKLKAMDEHKRLYLQEFLERSEVSVEDFIKLIKENETRLRNCYAETIELSSEDFIKKILMDAAFLIMVLLKSQFIDLRESSDRIFYPPYKKMDVRFDMFLLENQLPFYILAELYKQSCMVGNPQEYTMIELTHRFFKSQWQSRAIEDIWKIDFSEAKHWVDFLRIYQQPTEQQPREELGSLTAPSVKKLLQAGVKFELSSSKKVLDLKFDEHKGILEIPRLRFDDHTEILLRNIEALEQCHRQSYYVGHYISFMGLFVNSAKDVEILVQNRFLENGLSNKEAVANLFHNLRKENVPLSKNFHCSGLIERLNTYCKRPWNRWKATLKQDYFNTPWATISFTAAVILLILTVIQTISCIIQVA